MVGMLQAEAVAQAQDQHQAPVSDIVRARRRLAWLQAYRCSVLVGPGSEFPPSVRAGKGGRGRGAAGRGRGGPSSSC